LRPEGGWFALPVLIVIGTAIIAWIGQQHALGTITPWLPRVEAPRSLISGERSGTRLLHHSGYNSGSLIIRVGTLRMRCRGIGQIIA
jgi:hypothetical protein